MSVMRDDVHRMIGIMSVVDDIFEVRPHFKHIHTEDDKISR